eukprot:CAMPEP_0194496230 /NCGR_PEP_ID=MMETSP0253-20130528/13568_1 /TAXON_ID=2966 /ORGANISM="Noctiluca scintillans" /LENGTH=1087 /DNA_ID=CAMNT_0039337603 /DNA_START=27 /DNA_END=3290 /DNA_ORIENTATION=-
MKFSFLNRKSELVDPSVGDICETVAPVTMRSDESLNSNVVQELPSHIPVEIVQIGSGRRVKILAGKNSGWISFKTSSEEPLVRKKEQKDELDLSTVEVGHYYEVKSVATVRAGESLNSPILKELQPGTICEILELGSINKRRVQVAVIGNKRNTSSEGWISVQTKQGESLVSKASGPVTGNQSNVFRSSSSKTKALLEAARGGKIDAVKQILDGQTSTSVNCSDVGGKTPLMYAAAFGNAEVVEYFLTLSDIDINALDDTQKTALHHASKKSRKRRQEVQDSTQATIVQLLINRGAYIEARDHNGCTALMFAVANGDATATKMLLDAEANFNVKDFEGHTPLDYATNFRNTECVTVLKAHGATEQESDDNGDPEAKKKKNLRKKRLKEMQDTRSGSRLAETRVSLRRNMDLSELGIQGELDADISVLDNPEGVDDSLRALENLKNVTMRRSSLTTLQAAIRVAQAANVDVNEIEEAKKQARAINARACAREELALAIEDRDVHRLRRALKDAEEQQVSKSEVAMARSVLEQEEPREAAREQLRNATKQGDLQMLKAAVESARAINLSASELASFEEFLRGAESKEKAEAALRKAVSEKNVAALKFAIQQGRDAGVDASEVANAEEVLRIEEPKQEARNILAEAVENATIPELRLAIARAKEVGLGPVEYQEASIILEEEERKERALEEMKSAMELSKSVNMGSIEALRSIKARIGDVVNEAKDAGIPETDLLDAEGRRRKLHNAIEDLKGSIRVFCRVRPLSSKEIHQGDVNITRQMTNMALDVAGQQFMFDAVFMPGKQEEVFEDCRDIVQSAVDGYNVTIFAYGQTGAGKTFTMYGAPTPPEMKGTTPRTIEEIYRIIERDKGRFTYTVEGSMLELYQNNIVDLLSKTTVQPGVPVKKLNIRTDKGGMVQIEHLTKEDCSTSKAMMDLLERGNEQRTVASTAMNSCSSRSHLILMIEIISVNKETHEQIRGKILMCDLAGSERLKKSEVQGAQQKEAIEINKSLTALGDVIESLTKGHKQIPYRNHKLTQVMQDSLGGHAKTLMFVNISPASSNHDESIMSLKWATRSKRITNKQTKNVTQAEAQ